MAVKERKASDQQVEVLIGNLLRVGVLVAAATVLAGGVLFLVRHGHERPRYDQFHEMPEVYRKPTAIVQNTMELGARGLIQLGLLLLIATPVARVLFSVFAFLWERDYLYVALTLFVFLLLLYSLFWSTF